MNPPTTSDRNGYEVAIPNPSVDAEFLDVVARLRAQRRLEAANRLADALKDRRRIWIEELPLPLLGERYQALSTVWVIAARGPRPQPVGCTWPGEARVWWS